MARRKQEVALQQELETQEDWEEALSKEGLLVVDVYQEWAGPCVGMVGNLRRLKNELGDDLLRFAVAKADTIDSLERYRGKCEPCYMIYASGTLVYHLAGAKSPNLIKAITDELAQEHKVLAGEAERQGIRDPMMEEHKEKAQLDEEESEKEEIEVDQEVTVCLIKPDAVEAGKVEEILEQLAEHGLEVLTQEVRQLTEEEAKSFYSAHEEEEYFEDLIKFMCSGPSHVLVLSKGSTGDDTISEFRDLLGPKLVEEAKEQAPESLRARYGTANMTNAVHGSDNKDNAMKELAFFFPDYVVPKHKKSVHKPKIQRTLALIRPEALKNHKDDIIEKIKEAGFQIAFQKEVQLSKEQAENFYKEHQEQEYFEELTTAMSSGPLLALALAREDAVDGWRELLGPKEVPKAKEEAPSSLRAQFSVDEETINPLHGSDSLSTAAEELNYFFPMEQTVAMVKPDAYQTKDDIIQRIHEAGFRVAARKETQLTREVAEQIYENHKDKEYFDDFAEHLTNGQTLFLVLSREDAVDGWRSLIGPTDPEQAKEAAPGSIRADFGVDVKQNAVHGSSNPDQAKKEMQLIFGDVEFNEDGTLKGEEPDLDEAVVEKDKDEELDGAAMPEDEAEKQEEEQEGKEGEEEKKVDEEGKDEKADGQEADGEAAPAEEASPAEGEPASEEAGEEQKEAGDEVAAEDKEGAADGGEAAKQDEETEATAADDSADAQAAEPAADSSETPAEGAEAAQETSDAPAESSEAPAESTDAHAESTDAPAESTDAPAGSTDAPAEGTENKPDEQEQTEPKAE